MLFLNKVAIADTSKANMLELNRSVLTDDAALKKSNAWFAYKYFNPSMDVLNYASKVATQSRLNQWSELQLGTNIDLSDHFRFRLNYNKGSQGLDRPIFPKHIDTTYWGLDTRLQGKANVTETILVGIEAGYRLHKVPVYGVQKLQQGVFIVSAAPGKALFETSGEDKGWLVNGIVQYDLSETIRLYTHIEYRKLSVHVSTTSYDPLVIAVLESKQSPQTTPWQEEHIMKGIGMDWQIIDQLTLGFDIRQYSIKRHNYQPRIGFVDYNDTKQADIYLSYLATEPLQVFMHLRANSHFLLGDTPVLYNRRNNHTFKGPFGYASLGIIYKY